MSARGFPISTRTERGVDAARLRAASKDKQDTVFAVNRVVPHTVPKAEADKVDENEALICALEIDIEHRVNRYRKAFFCSEMCLCCPLNMCVNAICCSTLYMCAMFPAQEAKAAAAHRLILRERSLLYEVDEYVGPSTMGSEMRCCAPCLLSAGGGEDSSYASSDPGTYVPTCLEPGGVCGDGKGVHVPAFRRVIPLADVAQMSVEKHNDGGCCGHASKYGPDELVVLTTSNPAVLRDGVRKLDGIPVCVAIAGPKNATEFCEKVLSQRDKVIGEGGVPSTPSTAHAVQGSMMPSQLLGGQPIAPGQLNIDR